MLGSPVEAEDAVQDTMMRAWRSLDRFEGRAQLRSWLYRIATNVCLDMLDGRKRRARPMDLGPARDPQSVLDRGLPEVTWIEPIPDGVAVPAEGDPADVAVARETIRLAFVAALQHLPPRQRAVLILCEVLRWKAAEVATLLDTSVASVNSALQRARATLTAADVTSPARPPSVDAADAEMLERYVAAFQGYDMDALTSLIHEDATQSMPPFELWLRGREDILAWWVGQGAGCRGSKVIPTIAANGSPAFGQYKPNEAGDGYVPWALQVHRDRGRQGRRVHVLPRRRARLPAVRAAAALRRPVVRPARLARVGLPGAHRFLRLLGVSAPHCSSQWSSRLRAQPVGDDPEIAPPDLGVDVARALAQRAEHELQQRHVGRLDVGAQAAVGLRALDEPRDEREHELARAGDALKAVGARERDLLEAAVAGVHVAGLLEEADEPVPRVAVVQALLGERDELRRSGPRTARR